MKHEVDLKNYQVRTDLAIEAVAQQKDKTGVVTDTRTVNGITITKVQVDKENGTKIGKKAGMYITIEFQDVTDHENQAMVTKVFQQELIGLLKSCRISEEASCFVIGLGNKRSTPDALGPMVADHIVVTNHLYLYEDLEEGFRRCFAMAPGVMGETGIETSDLISSVVQKIKPDFMIVVDALASQSVERVNKTIQMTDTGIHPGSGVGNKRKEISFQNIGIPVIAIGIPTVVDAVSIVSDTIEYMQKHYAYTKKTMNEPFHKLVLPNQAPNYLHKNVKIEKADQSFLLGALGSLTEKERRQLILEVLSPIGYNLMVTPKEVDFLMEKLSIVVSEGINQTLHTALRLE